MLSRGRVIRLAFLAVGITVTATAFAACTNGRRDFEDRREVFIEPDADPSLSAPVCRYRCSRDLKKVLKSCDGAEPEETSCPPEKGCGIDKCIDACDSAASSKGSTGCSFWTLPADDTTAGTGACFAAMIANTWDRGVNITAEWGDAALDISESVYTAKMKGDNPEYTRLTGPLPPSEVAIVFLAEAAVQSDEFAVRCPPGTKAAVDVDPIRHGTTRTKAFHLKTDVPVSAYSSFPYGGAESYFPTATLLLPESSWDTGYIAVSTGKFGDLQAASAEKRTLQIVARENDTKVSMRPNATIDEGKDVAPVGANEVVTWTLKRGEVLQITQRGGVTGSPIQADKPIGLFGGAPCNFLPSGFTSCDLTQQQIPPFAQWGTEYALVPYAARIQSVTGKARETVPWTFVGAVDGTKLTYQPQKPPGAPDALQAGQAVYFMTDQLVTVKSQDSKHPFYAAVQMTSSGFGGGANGGGRTPGDPDFVNIVPSDQFLDRYVFFADYTYPDTTLTVVRRRSDKGFLPVEIDCGGAIEGFAPLGSSGEYEYAWVKLTVGSVAQKLSKGECGYGRHEVWSNAPFSITVWGVGQDASYGYAGGMGSRPINAAPLPQVN